MLFLLIHLNRYVEWGKVFLLLGALRAVTTSLDQWGLKMGTKGGVKTIILMSRDELISFLGFLLLVSYDSLKFGTCKNPCQHTYILHLQSSWRNAPLGWHLHDDEWKSAGVSVERRIDDHEMSPSNKWKKNAQSQGPTYIKTTTSWTGNPTMRFKRHSYVTSPIIQILWQKLATSKNRRGKKRK